MLNLGDSAYEAEHRMKEVGRVLAERQTVKELRSSPSGLLLKVRDAYYRQMALFGGRVCDLGLEVGCAFQARAVANCGSTASC
jgi:hypothetical protein